MIDERLIALSLYPEYSPVLLMWIIMNHAHGIAAAQVQSFGGKLIQQKVVERVSDAIKDPHVKVNFINSIYSI